MQRIIVSFLLSFSVSVSILYADQHRFDRILEDQKIQDDISPQFSYMYDEEKHNLVVLKNGLWLQSIIVPNEIEAVLDSSECMMFFIRKIKNENFFIAEYYQHHLLDFIDGNHFIFYYNLFRKLKKLKLYIFDKEQESLFCDQDIECFINLPRAAFKKSRHINLKFQNSDKDYPDCIRIELPES